MRARRLSPAGVQAWDRRNAAMHEAGHLIIARHLGMRDGQAALFASDTPGDAYNKAWIGNFQYRRSELEAVTRPQRLMFSVAGAVAEDAWRRSRTGEEPGFWADTLLDPDAMSATDWAGAECPPGDASEELVEAAEAVERLFEPGSGILWPSLCRAGRLLIRDRFLEVEPWE